MKTLYFLGGLPRSGSTLLGSLLNQHKDIYVSPTSPLGDILTDVEKIFNKVDQQFTFDKNNISFNVYKSIIDNFYNHIEKPIVVDKNRFWGQNINTVEKFISNKPKIVCTYRPIPEVLTSYISLIERTNYTNNFIDNHLLKDNLEITNNNRAEYIWRYYVSSSYKSMVYSLTKYSEWIYLVDYNDLLSNPQKTLNKIYNFLEVDQQNNNFDEIENSCGELKDEAWGLKDLHTIRPKLSKISQDPIEVIGEENVNLYSKFNI
jgi:sulfotransferase